MKLAFVLYEYTPWGGRERNCAAAARACARAGHDVLVVTRRWAGPRPPQARVLELGSRGRRNIARDEAFVRDAREALAAEACDLVVGFDLFPEADVLYAADPCLALEARRRFFLVRWTRRVRRRLAWERALLEPAGRARVLVLTERQREEFRRAYGTPPERLVLLPPNLDDAPAPARAAGAQALAALGIEERHLVLLFVGSDFRRKGLDRAIDALAALPERARLVAVGDTPPGGCARRARARGVRARVAFAGPRHDVPALLARADVLVHPARKETAGVVLLEALRQGVPVVTTDACGFAPHVEQAGAGVVLRTPFRPETFREWLRLLVRSEEERGRMGARGRAYARAPELYGRHERIRELLEAWGRERSARAAEPR